MDESNHLCVFNVERKRIHHIQPFDRNPGEVATEETGNEGVDATPFYHNAVGSAIPTPWKAFPADFWRLQSSCKSTLNWNSYLPIYTLTTSCDGSIDSSEDLKRDTMQAYKNTTIKICTREAKAYRARYRFQIRRRV